MVGKLSGKYLDQQSEILNSLLLLFLLSQVLTKYTETTTSFYVIESFFFFKKKKKGTELVSLLPFLHEFWQKYFSCFLFTGKSQYNFWDIRQYVYCNCFLSSFLHHKFSNNLSFLIKPFPTWPKKSGKSLKNEKSFQDEIKIIFHQFERAFIETNRINFFWRRVSDFNYFMQKWKAWVTK